MIARVKLQNCCAAFCSSEGEDGVQVRYYEYRCQGVTRRWGKTKHTKEHTLNVHCNLPTYTPPPAPMYRPIYHPSLSHVRTITQIVQNALCIFHWHKQTSLQSSQCLVCP